jgi:tetratricopeptide (TPR) repeat protein
MLTVVREHVLEVAAVSADGDIVAQRHAAYCVGLTQKGAPELHGPDQTIWLNRLSLELANCRAAFNWLLDAGDLAQAIQLVVSLGPFYIERSLLDESRHMIARLQQALKTAVPPVAPMLQIKLDNMAGSLAYYAADWATALVGFRQALATARALPSENTPDVQHEMAYALDGMAAVAAARGAFAQAKRLCTDSLARSRTCEDRWLSAITLLTLGEIACSEGDLAESNAYFSESLSILRAVGDRSFAAVALHNLAQVALQRGELSQALTYQHEALEMAVAILNYRLIARTLEGVGKIALVQGQLPTAVRLFGASAELRRANGVVLQPAEQEERAAILEGARQQMGAAFVQALGEGCLLTLDATVELALTG